MVLAWLITLPAAGTVGALMWWLGDLLGGYAGPVVVFLSLVALAAYMFVRSQRQPVHPGNVNDEWTGTPSASVLPPEKVAHDGQPAVRGRGRLEGAARRAGPRCRAPGGVRHRASARWPGVPVAPPRSMSTPDRIRSAGRLAALCFLVVLAGIGLGLTIILAAGQGKIVSFDHVYPTIVDKPK